ncbi:unnamed protein product, partial [Polarella glacialis]
MSLRVSSLMATIFDGPTWLPPTAGSTYTAVSQSQVRRVLLKAPASAGVPAAVVFTAPVYGSTPMPVRVRRMSAPAVSQSVPAYAPATSQAYRVQMATATPT